MKDCKITEAEAAKVLMKNVNDRPNALATYGEAKKNSVETKDLFDRQFELVKQKHNEMCEEVSRESELLNGRMATTEETASEAAAAAGNAITASSSAVDTANTATDTANRAKEIADEVKARADRGEFKGEKGDQGDKGDQGERGLPGADGKTPVKGADYFTESDKSEMVGRVIAALPKYNGEAVDA